MKIKTKIVSIVLMITLLFSNGTFLAVKAANVPLTFIVTTDKGSIVNGQTGVDFAISQMKFAFNASYQVNPQRSLQEIKVLANGKYDDTANFDMTFQGGVLTLSLKDSASTGEELPLFQLRKQTLYNIQIPAGLLKHADGVTYNEAVQYYFVTKGDTTSFYPNDILVKTTPYNNQSQVDDTLNKIELEFADEIVLNPEVPAYKEQHIQISTTRVSGATPIPSYEKDTIANFDVTVSGNKLILQSKSGKLKDFAKYTVKLKDNTVYLKNSTFPFRIYNNDASGTGWTTIEFTTDDMLATDKQLARTYPVNNEQGVPVEPTIAFYFKYPIQFLNQANLANQVHISSDAGSFALNASTAVTISVDGKMLEINVNDLEGSDKIYPLRRNTTYTVTVDADTVQFKEYGIHNPKMQLTFTTRGEGTSPYPTKYASDTAASDDITALETTKLGADGSFYIFFDKPIQWDKQAQTLSVLEATKLYKLPTATTKKYDTAGKLYDATFSFNTVAAAEGRILPEGVIDPNQMEQLSNWERLPLDKVEIVSPNSIRVKPKYPLLNRNKYRLLLDRRILEDVNRYNLQKDIDFTFWTAKSTNGVKPVWKTTAIPSQESLSPPFTLLVDQEVIPKAQDEILMIEPSKVKRISFEALKGITLVDAYNLDTTTNTIGFSKYTLEYYFENGIKKTKIYLFPSQALKRGNYYKLKVASGVFETRGGAAVDPLELSFTVQGDQTAPKGVYAIENNAVKINTLWKTQDFSFTIKGFNFTESTVQSITLSPVNGRAVGTGDIVISKEDIEFKSVAEIIGKIRGANAQALAREERVGEYRVTVNFSDNSSAQLSILFTVLSKGKPVIKAKEPAEGSAWYDEKTMNSQVVNGVTRYFIKLTFEDLDGKLTFDDADSLSFIRDGIKVYAQGSGINALDVDFLNSIMNLDAATRNAYLFKKDSVKGEAYFYLPIQLLRSQTTYDVIIDPELFYYSDIVGSDGKSELIRWSFTTMAVPSSTEVMIGTVGEAYDEDQPIIITGNFFYSSTVTVYFNTTKAENVRVKQDPSTGKQYLEVYLPTGRDRLDQGLYNVIIENDANHQRTVYGAFSVVKKGEHVPNEENRVKKEETKGDVLSEIQISKDKLLLKSKYADDPYLELDLDELMGEEVLMRAIEYQGSYSSYIGELDTKSKWANITLYDLTLSAASDGRTISLYVGRIDPTQEKALKDKLKGKAFKSTFIQVTGTNFTIGSLKIRLPYKNSEGKKLKVFRYDVNTRKFYEVKSTVDQVNQIVEVESSNPGIFVAVE